VKTWIEIGFVGHVAYGVFERFRTVVLSWAMYGPWRRMRRLAWLMRWQSLRVGPNEVDFASTAAIDDIAGDAGSVVRRVSAAAGLLPSSISVLVSDCVTDALLAMCGVLS
jgi:hypothetical protein